MAFFIGTASAAIDLLLLHEELLVTTFVAIAIMWWPATPILYVWANYDQIAIALAFSVPFFFVFATAIDLESSATPVSIAPFRAVLERHRALRRSYMIHPTSSWAPIELEFIVAHDIDRYGSWSLFRVIWKPMLAQVHSLQGVGCLLLHHCPHTILSKGSLHVYAFLLGTRSYTDQLVDGAEVNFDWCWAALYVTFPCVKKNSTVPHISFDVFG